MKNLIPLTLFSVMMLASCRNADSSGFDAENAKSGGFEFLKTSAEESPPPMDKTVNFTPPSISDRKVDKMEAGSVTTAANATSLTYSFAPVSNPIKITEKIKKTANIDISVENYKVARIAIDKIVKAGHAYIGGENERNSTYK